MLTLDLGLAVASQCRLEETMAQRWQIVLTTVGPEELVEEIVATKKRTVNGAPVSKQV